MKKIKILTLLVCAFLMGADYLGHKQIDRYENIRGAVFQIVIFDNSMPKEKLLRISDAAFRAIEQVEEELNSEADNIIGKINKGKKGDVFPLGEDAFFVIKEALWASKTTKSAVDITDMPLRKIWQDAKSKGEPPAKNVTDSALPKVNAQYILLNPDSKTLTLQKDSIRLNVDNEAKAYAVDKAVEYLKSQGITSAFVRGDGITRLLGTPKEAPVWRLGIEHPRRIDEYAGVFELADAKCLSTATDYDDFFIYKDRRYPMTVHPKTGRPAENGVTSVTVMANTALTAELLSRAFFVMSPEDSYNLADSLKERQVEVIVIEELPNKKFSFSSSEGARLLIKDIIL